MNRVIALINIIIYFLGQIVFPIIFVKLTSFFTNINSLSEYKNAPNMFILLMLFSNALTLLILLIINRQYLKIKLAQIKESISKTIVSGIKGYIVIIVVNSILSIILMLLKINAGEPQNQQAITAIINNSTFFLSLLTIGLITPILEEIIFRMSFMGVLIKDRPSKNWLFYILAALLFALMHEHNIIFNFSSDSLALFLTYFGSAMVLSGVYKLTKHNIGSTSITHILNNSIAIIIAGVI